MATWTKNNETFTSVGYEATITPSDTSTDILLVDPAWGGSIVLNHGGGGDSLNFLLATAGSPQASDLITAKDAITADYDDTIIGHVTGAQITGAVAGTHNISMVFKKNKLS